MNVTPDDLRHILRSPCTTKRRLLEAFRECIELWEAEQTARRLADERGERLARELLAEQNRSRVLALELARVREAAA